MGCPQANTPDAPKDTALVAACQRGDMAAWRTLFDRFSDAVYRWSQGFGLDHASAEEVTQEVFATAFRCIGKCSGDGQLPAWLFQITRRHAANWRRTSWFRRAVAGSREPEATQVASPHEISLDLRRCLARLPVRLAEILILHDLDGHSRDDIARMLDIPAGTVASRLNEARRRLEKGLSS